MPEVTTAALRALYKEDERDEHVFELKDSSGLQIVRKYPSSLKLGEKRMFIKFFLLKKEENLYVLGGVDTVSDNKDGFGWTIQSSKAIFLQKPTNYFFGETEDIHFDPVENKVIFKNSKYPLNGFIDLLEKNHLRDMFLFSRFVNFFKIGFLHFLYFLADSKFKKFDHLFENRKSVYQPASIKTEGSVSSPGDPLFHYFHIYKNLLGFFVFLLLLPTFIFSLCLSEKYFTVTNPFLLILSLFILFALDKVSATLSHVLLETSFVQSVTRSALEQRGSLKKFKVGHL